jgi:hypothetical protein
MRAVLREIGHVENEDAAGVAGRGVLVDIGAHRVFDLDAGDILSARLRRTMMSCDWPT